MHSLCGFSGKWQNKSSNLGSQEDLFIKLRVIKTKDVNSLHLRNENIDILQSRQNIG